jgi:hypothetical protein
MSELLKAPDMNSNHAASAASTSEAVPDTTCHNLDTAPEQHVWNATVEDPFGLENVVATIKASVSKVKHCVVSLNSAKDRRLLHMWCEAQNLFHVSFSSENQKIQYVYYCFTCGVWAQENDVRYSRCCNDGSCGDYSIFCRICDDNAIWHQDAHEEPDQYKRKIVNVNRNDRIAISSEIAHLYPIFHKLRIREKKAEQWVKKREAKLRKPKAQSAH